MTPDPEDRSISKRNWEIALQNWKHSVYDAEKGVLDPFCHANDPLSLIPRSLNQLRIRGTTRASAAEVTGPSASRTFSLGRSTGPVSKAEDASSNAYADDFMEPPGEPFVRSTTPPMPPGWRNSSGILESAVFNEIRSKAYPKDQELYEACNRIVCLQTELQASEDMVTFLREKQWASERQSNLQLSASAQDSVPGTQGAGTYGLPATVVTKGTCSECSLREEGFQREKNVDE